MTLLRRLLFTTLAALLIGAPPAFAARTDVRLTASLVPGDGVVLEQRGTFTGSPFGHGTIRLSTRLGQAQGAVFAFVMTTSRGSVRGSGSVSLRFRGRDVFYDGTASITAGSGAYRRFRAPGLRMSGRGVVGSSTFRARLWG